MIRDCKVSLVLRDRAVVRLVECAAGLEPGAILSGSHRKAIVMARAAAVILLRERGRSLSDAARTLSLHHTTVGRLERVYQGDAFVAQIADSARRLLAAASANSNQASQAAALAAIVAEAERRLSSAEIALVAAREAVRSALEVMDFENAQHGQ